MEHSSIVLKVLSCKNVKAFNFFQKLTLYALVSIVSDDPKRKLEEKQKQQQRTQTDRDSDGDGSNPEWNHEMRFDLGWVSLHDCGHLFFHFEFRHDALIIGDKLIGQCRVPFLDLVQDAGCVGDAARFVSYEVRNGDGKPNGIFNFSYRFNGIGIGIGIGTHSSQSQILEGRITGYPVLDPQLQHQQQHQHHHATNQSHVQYPTSEIENPSCRISYPTVMSPVGPVHEGLLHSPSAPAPPSLSSPSSGEYNYFYPPPPPLLSPPPPPPYQYPPPPPPPVAHGPHYYPPFGHEAHLWPSSPNIQHRW